MSLAQQEAQLKEWLADFGNSHRFRFETGGEHGRVVFCTAAHTYHISFSASYLGCTASSRVVRPGEDWTRGNDLPDGKFSRETFDAIVRAIIAYELVELAPQIEQEATPVLA